MGFLTAVILFAIYNSPQESRQQYEGPLCGTSYTIIWNDVTKYDESKIINSLKVGLSQSDFSGDVVGSHPWWEYVSISKPDENGTSSFSIPSANMDILNNATAILEKIDGISRVNAAKVTWCTWFNDPGRSAKPLQHKIPKRLPDSQSDEEFKDCHQKISNIKIIDQTVFSIIF